MSYPTLDAVATGNRIKELRKQKRIKVREIQEYMGFESEQSVYKWQRGEALPNIDNLYALSILLDTPIDHILVGAREEEDASPLLHLCG